MVQDLVESTTRAWSSSRPRTFFWVKIMELNLNGSILLERGSCGGSYSNRSGGSHVHQDCLYNPSHPRKVYRPTKPPKQLPASFPQWNPHLQWHIAMSWHTVEGYGRAPRSKGEVDNIMILESSQRLKTYLDFFFWPEGAPGIILPQ